MASGSGAVGGVVVAAGRGGTTFDGPDATILVGSPLHVSHTTTAPPTAASARAAAAAKSSESAEEPSSPSSSSSGVPSTAGTLTSTLPQLVAPPAKTTCMRVSEFMVGAAYAIAVVMISVVIWQLVEWRSDISEKGPVIAWSIAGIFVGLSLPLSLHDIHIHMLHYVHPLQRLYVRILWMVPVYGASSWISLRFRGGGTFYLTLMRECFEAYVIHSFMALMIEYLSGTSGDREALKAALVREKGPLVVVCPCFSRSPPACARMRTWRNGGQLLHRAQFGVWQYVVVRIVFAIAACAQHYLGLYHEGSFYDFTNLYVYNTLAVNTSQMYALWVLGVLYFAARHRLKPLNPVRKFLVVKAVVFFAWWQAVGLSGLVSIGVIQPTLTFTASEVSSGIQDLLICIECLFFAIAHHYAFGVSDFWRHDRLGPIATGPAMGAATAALHLMPLDVLRETKAQVQGVFGLRNKRDKRKFEAEREARAQSWGRLPQGPASPTTVVVAADAAVDSIAAEAATAGAGKGDGVAQGVEDSSAAAVVQEGASVPAEAPPPPPPVALVAPPPPVAVAAVEAAGKDK